MGKRQAQAAIPRFFFRRTKGVEGIMTRPAKQQTLSVIEAQFPSPRLGEDYLCLQHPAIYVFPSPVNFPKALLQLVDVACFDVPFCQRENSGSSAFRSDERPG